MTDNVELHPKLHPDVAGILCGEAGAGRMHEAVNTQVEYSRASRS
jgi:hypothetical protein